MERSRFSKDKFWFPVLDTRMFEVGDVIWIDHGEAIGRHEVRFVGRGELLVRPIPWWEFVVRLYRGRLRRAWLRLKRRIFR